MTRVMLVHGSDAPRDAVVQALESNGFIVFAVPSCADARPLVRLFRPDVIVVDGPTDLARLSARVPLVVLYEPGWQVRASGPDVRIVLWPHRGVDVAGAVRSVLAASLDASAL